MNGNSTNQDSNDDGNLFGMRKIPYWEIYGVKRFPYRGRRKFTPLLYQSFDGGMKISNDVFGLTIRQFERIYTACLERRITQQQWILNLRYPDKSSNEYLEYLQNCTDCTKDHLLWLEKKPGDKYLYEHLVERVGTEIDIRTRQRLFIISDNIENEFSSHQIKISSGSLAEGLDLPGSDIDIMYVNKIEEADIIQNVRSIKRPIHRTTYVMETDIDHPGFTRLRLVAEKKKGSFFVPFAGKSLYLRVNPFVEMNKQSIPTMAVFKHGPCLSDQNQMIDFAFCLRSKYLPHNAIPWAYRHRRQWPPNIVIDRIIDYGCLMVPIGPKNESNYDFLWRLSFSIAEKILVHSFNFTQLLCYGLLKLTLKNIINRDNDAKELLCSYFLKTALFWVSEEEDIETFQLPKLYFCFSLCLDKLISWVNICYCPNYFIPEHNMFLEKINQSNNKILLCVLESIKCGGIDGLITNLFQLDNANHRISRTNSESSSVMLEFLFYRLNGSTSAPIDIQSCFKGLALTESFIKSESSTFIVNACKYHYAEISQYISQLLPSPNTRDNTYNIHKRYHRHLQDGIKTDAVSGWLLYASFHYVIGQYNVTLRLTDYVLSRCTPDMRKIGHEQHREKNYYNSKNVHSTLTLIERMKICIVDSVTYLQHSSIIPEELQLEVKESPCFTVPPVILSHCLRFLCYHHLGDISKSQQALHSLYLTGKNQHFMSNVGFSESVTILGVCFEISGDKKAAYQWYDFALQCPYFVCPSAKIRKSKVFEI
ncbi:unnamed protein product [Mytilus coruscus]|uniref:Mab-21-like HhH/H2TH-like domain-containing protein n=1 Tax=Mytilus coruscus TaxID=42192 RepID=A0A6J8AG22_MYTCO|nr:unnamed protein product [Mytilus coruscus]